MRLKRFLNNDLSFLFLLFISFIAYFGTIITMYNYALSLVFVLVQDLLLFYLILKNKVSLFASIYTIFLALSFETAAYMSDKEILFYGFKNLNFIVSNSLLVLFIASIFFFIFNFKKIRKIKDKSKMKSFFYGLLFINFIAIIIGIFNLMIKDNNSSLNSIFLTNYINEIYYGFFTIMNCFILYISFMISNDKEQTKRLFLKSILAIFISLSYVPYLVYLLGYRGGYGGELLFSISKFILPFLILFPVFYKTKYNFLIYISWFIGVVIPILFFGAGTGKELIFLITSIILFLYYKITNKIKINRGIMLLFALFLLVVSIFILQKLSQQGTRLGDKANQIYSMITFWEKGWLDNMPTSPKVRIYEVISICIEYIKKPIYIITGKGYSGAFKDYTGYFSSLPIETREGAFSAFEFENNYFYRVHETIFRVPLCFGIIGIVYFIYWIFYCFKKKTFSGWLGLLWLCLFFNTSQTLSCVLIMGIFISFFERRGEKVDNLFYKTS